MIAPARRFGLTAGTAYAALGVLGMAATGFSGFASPRGDMLLWLELNPLQNLLHFSIGIALVVGAARDERCARTLTMLAGASFTIVGLLGIGMVGSTGNVLALNQAGNALHLVTGLFATAATLRSTYSERATDELAPRLATADPHVRSTR